jgi:hypothetical protein
MYSGGKIIRKQLSKSHMNTDMNSAGLAWSGEENDTLVVPPSAPAMDGSGATTGGTGQGSGEEHITFGKKAREFDEAADPAEKDFVADSSNEFSVSDVKGKSDAVSLL